MLLNKYLYKSISKPITMGVFGCTFLLIIDALSEIIEQIVIHNVPFFQVLELLSYKMVYLLSLTVPMGMMIGCLLAYGSLTDENELVAMKSLGIGLGRVMAPTLAMSFFVTLFLFFINQVVEPIAYEKQSNVAKKIAYDRPSLGLAERKFIEGISGYSIYLDSYKAQEEKSGDFIIFANEKGNTYSSIVTGKEIGWNDGYMVLKQATAYQLDAKGEKEAFVQFDKQEIPIRSKLSGFEAFGGDDERSHMSFTQLWSEIQLRKSRKVSYVREEMWFHTKISLCTAAIVMALLGALLASGTHRRFRRGDGKLTGIAILFVYWMWIFSSHGIITNGQFPSQIMWIPNIAFGLIAIAMFVYKRRA